MMVAAVVARCLAVKTRIPPPPSPYVLHKFSSTLTGNIVRPWSLRQLAALGVPKDDGRAQLTAHHAQELLKDVSLRLRRQEGICRNLMECINNLGRDDIDTGTIKTSTMTTENTQTRQRVVRAVNQPVHTDRKGWLEQRAATHRAHQKAKQQLHNIAVLHRDTYQLTNVLLENPNVIERFSPADKHLLAATMEQIRSRHASTVETLADIAIDLRDDQTSTAELDSAMATFLRGRMGVQLLCDHYVALNKGKPYGGVSVDCLLADVLEDAMTEARHVCDAHLQESPEVLSTVPATAAHTLVRPWVHHALVELLKNAMASNVEAAAGESALPNIFVQYTYDDSFVYLHIVDQGVGLHNDGALKRAFGFAQSSANRRWDRLEEQQSYAMVRSPLQSLGVGLPLSRIMMRHFGGDILLTNNTDRLDMPSDEGCTATIQLRRDEDFLEELPTENDSTEDTRQNMANL